MRLRAEQNGGVAIQDSKQLLYTGSEPGNGSGSAYSGKPARLTVTIRHGRMTQV